jgi:hypothetical protein
MGQSESGKNIQLVLQWLRQIAIKYPFHERMDQSDRLLNIDWYTVRSGGC